MKIGKEQPYRSTPLVNKDNDMVRVTLDMTKHEWREIKKIITRHKDEIKTTTDEIWYYITEEDKRNYKKPICAEYFCDGINKWMPILHPESGWGDVQYRIPTSYELKSTI
jgi:hypothetical protein